LEPWTFGGAGHPVFSPDGSLVIVLSEEGLTAWDTARRELRWKIAARHQFYRFSEDGKRVVLVDSSLRELLFLEAETGRRVNSIPRFGEYKWLDDTGTRVATLGRAAVELWDVDRATVLRQIELQSVAEEEEDRDLATLDASPTAEALLEIARRRLRACKAGPAATR
jgi:hypothetical protein